jgi:hypothetical protein
MTATPQQITFGEMRESGVRDVLRCPVRSRCRVHETVWIDAMVSSKYEPVSLPTRKDAVAMATEREAWASAARERDQPGSAREFELTALLLRFYANTASWHTDT